jgi:DegV family protein with EDD domain
MSRVAIVTDSNSGITQADAEKNGVYVIPMPFTIDEEDYYEDINLSQDKFYELLEKGGNVMTSQPSPDDVMAMWDKLLKNYDEIVHIPMSSGLSGSCQTAFILAGDYDGKVQVVDNQRISVTQRRSVYDAVMLAKEGKSAEEIRDILVEDKFNSSIYITIPSLYYLKKGGRLTPAVAALGTILKIKPVLQIQGEKLDKYSMARTMNQAKTIMMNAIRNDMENRFGGVDPDLCEIAVAHSHNKEDALSYKMEIEKEFPGFKVRYVDPLSLSVSCHIGPGALAIAVVKKLR